MNHWEYNVLDHNFKIYVNPWGMLGNSESKSYINISDFQPLQGYSRIKFLNWG